MEESPPAGTPSDGVVVEEKRRARQRPRIPTSVLVTLLVTLLSVMVAPAIARQWEDRKRAQEVKGALVEAIAVEAVPAIEAGLGGVSDRSTTAAQDRWRRARFLLEAKIRTYGEADLVAAWRSFATLIREFLVFAEEVDGQQRYYAQLSEHPKLEASILRAVRRGMSKKVARFLPHDIARELVSPDPDDKELAEYYAELGYTGTPEQAFIASEILERETDVLEAIPSSLFEAAMLTHLQRLTDRVLDAHLSGFSTTRGDLLRDLLP